MAVRRRYTFAEQKTSKGGKLALKLSAASLACFAVSVIVSLAFEGNAGPYVGAISLTAALLSVYGFYTGMKSFSERDVSPAFSILGSIASGVMMVGYLTLFLTGLR